MVVMRDVEIPNWLKGLPLAPEFRPTDTEFADPIAYISKIEKEASVFGICKIIPPLPKPSKKYVLHNLNRSLSKCPDFVSNVNMSAVCSPPSKLGSGDGGNDGEVPAVFTTRHQELGQSVKKSRGAIQPQQPAVQKQVWQSGEVYTLEQFEIKSKAFARSLLSMVKEVSPLVIEAMFWTATSEKPIYIEYANDVPGSGFSEPEGSHRYFLKRKRNRIFKKNCGATSVCKKHEVDVARNSPTNDQSVSSSNPDPNLSTEVRKACSGSSTFSSDETSKVSRQKSLNASSEMEGTAGWKLSNSPWNLQVIARSPGSLTRFMPDDIPGVTSPMVYIGMLFSWFAWHVEDHELHSMNYLHTGSPKTWYAVPGDYAFDFEEVIRSQAYGGNIDRLAALKLLGEKTTLLSPEVVVTSGIPCCRLIQHPGEFVVTFPRAYHVGFSHGFNCGEAANFGTPQWLQVAKEAAVRRAAMNYLPMLSHQQLLYLLTMSFVSRVPRSLLPGARSSRLRDRQKEEREKSVKKVFIEDIVKENKLSTVLLAKESTYRAVLWNPESLPSHSKEPQMPDEISAVDTTSKEIVTNIHPEDNNSQNNNLLDEMSTFMETVNDLYLDDDDLSCDFQVDSGTLACVACGILGFPFMAVVQPSERTSMELVLADHSLVQEGSTISKSVNTHSSSDVDVIIKDAVSENLSPVPDLPQEGVPIPSTTKLEKAWNGYSEFLRPRIFCLEHAAQIEELLRSKGGANVLVICHSDYQKMKAHAAVIAEEIGYSLTYNEVTLDSASQQDLNLINLAIDEEEHDECGEDWTSKLGINLRYCVKARKNSPSPKIQHALKLSGLFSDMTPASNLYLKWQSRRSRSKFKVNHSASLKPCQSIQIKGEKSRGKLDGIIVRKEEKIIQYSRRNSKSKSACSARLCKASALPIQTISATFGDVDKSKNTRSDSAGLDLFGKSQMQHEILAVEATGHMSKNSIPAQVADFLATASSLVGSVEAQIEDQTLQEITMDDKACHLSTKDSSEIQNEMSISEDIKEKSVTTSAEKSSSFATTIPTVEISEMQGVIVMEEITVTNEVYDLATHNTSEGQCDMQADVDNLSNMVSDLANPTTQISDLVVETCDVQVESEIVDKSSPNGEFSDCGTGYNEIQLKIQTDHRYTKKPVSRETCAAKELCSGATMEDKMLQEIQTTNRGPGQEPPSSYVTLTDKPSTAPMTRRSEVPQETCAAGGVCSGPTLDGKVPQEIQTPNESSAKEIVSNVTPTDQPGAVPVDERSEATQGTCAAEDLCIGGSSDEKVPQEIHTTKGSFEEGPMSGCVTLLTQPPAISVGKGSDVLSGTCTSDLRHYMALETESKQEYQATNGSSEEPGRGVAVMHSQYVCTSTGESSEVPSEICTRERSCNGMTQRNELEQESQTANRSNVEDSISSCLTLGQPSLASVEENPKVLTETCTESGLSKCATSDNEVLSPAPGKESSEGLKAICAEKSSDTDVYFSQEKSEQKDIESTAVNSRSTAWKERKRKRKREVEQITEDKSCYNGFFRSPCEGLRPRGRKDASRSGTDMNIKAHENQVTKKVRKCLDGSVSLKGKKELVKKPHSCDLDGCRMSFKTKAELLSHKRNQCPHPGCGKRFSSHKYAVLHERVHDDDRPLKCPWKGCTMSFKWAWARTEHIRVHTGERPYQCKIEGCGLSFRFISDFSRHRRKTGHHVK